MPDERIEALLADYLEGELSPGGAAEVERHLARHPRQRRLIEQMTADKALLAGLPRVAAPPGLLDPIDPALERAALFEAPPAGRSRWASPQALALAATVVLLVTLAAAVVALLPGRPGDDPELAATVTTPTTTRSAATRPQEPAFAAPTNRAAVASPDRRQVDQPESPTTRPDDAVTADGRAEETVPPAGDSTLPSIPAEAVLVRADVSDVRAAGADVAGFLALQSLTVAGGGVRAAIDLPRDLRDRAELRDDAQAVLFVVPQARLSQAGLAATELAEWGSPTVTELTPGRRSVQEPNEAEPPFAAAEVGKGEAQRIYFDDALRVYLFSRDDPPADPRPGTPDWGRSTDVRVEVSPDGYADFGAIGLGRMDVLGRDVTQLRDTLQASLRDLYGIAATADVKLIDRAAPAEGRTAQTLAGMEVDRQPLAAGDLVQVDRPDGSWAQAVISPDQELDLGDLGTIRTQGRSAAALQAELRARLPEAFPAARPAPSTARVAPIPAPATNRAPMLAGEPQPLRLKNLSARRKLPGEPTDDRRVPIVIVLQSREEAVPATRPAAQPATDPWGDLDGPATR